MTIYKGFNFGSKNDQFGMITAARYEMEHKDNPNDKILQRAKELQEQWQKVGLYHTNTITSVLYALRGM